MMRRQYVTFAVLLVLAATLVAGCTDLVGRLKQGQETAVVVRNEAAVAVAAIQEQIESLPPGDPVRVQLEEKLTKIQKILADADTIINTVGEALVSIETGQVTPGIQTALSAVPYGVYISLGLTVLIALQRHLRGKKVLAALTKVVQSWKDVGAELTPEEKLAVRAIQGEETTAMVQTIRDELAKEEAERKASSPDLPL